MATNPMQRKARNSFILGMLLMLVITGAIIALLFMQLSKKNKAEREAEKAKVSVYVLGEDVKSGQIVTPDMLTTMKVNRSLVPSNATGDIEVITNYALQDKEGNSILTRKIDGKPELVLEKNEKEYIIEQEDNGNYFIDKNKEVKQDKEGKYSISNKNSEADKEFIELNEVPLIAKVDMKKNTMITTEYISKGDNLLQDDVRIQEYNAVILPIDLETGDYIDVRMMLPNGQDFIVISKKEIEVPNIDGVDSDDTILMNLTEDETLHMSCAIVEAFKIKGAKLYATKYTEAGMQKAATPTYVLSAQTLKLLQNDPNVLETAKNELAERYRGMDVNALRNEAINGELDKQGQQADSNYQQKITESITNSKGARKKYLESLAAPVE